jgi:SAM-dependent methyltransferase
MPPFGQGRMLDVGCGAGEYLRDMQQLGWDVYGVDLSPMAVRAANERIGPARVWEGTIQMLDPSLNAFDLVTMNHCLEHVPDPQSTLDEVSRRLAPTGKVKIIIPDVSGFEANLFRRYWVGLDVPRHLFNFSRKTLSKFLQRSELHIESRRPQMWPWSVYGSFELAVEKGLHLRWHNLDEVPRSRLTKSLFLLGMLSYSLGYRGAIEVVACKNGTQAQ